MSRNIRRHETRVSCKLSSCRLFFGSSDRGSKMGTRMSKRILVGVVLFVVAQVPHVFNN
jgi:hypothetical protein